MIIVQYLYGVTSKNQNKKAMDLTIMGIREEIEISIHNFIQYNT